MNTLTPADYVHDALVGWMEDEEPAALRSLLGADRQETAVAVLGWMARYRPDDLRMIQLEDSEGLSCCEAERAPDLEAMCQAVDVAFRLEAMARPWRRRLR